MNLKKIAINTLLFGMITNANMIQNYKGEITIGYEKWKLPQNESLGITRLGILFDITPWWYSGINIYGAVKGHRGGFFTLGFDNGLQSNPNLPLQLRTGLFVGAGGGGGAPQGGGLMLRPYLELKYNSKNFSLSTGVSHVRFPNGKINSTQVFGAFYIPFNGIFWNGWPTKTENYSSTLKGYEIENLIRGGEYIVSSSAKTTEGKKLENMNWMGSELRRNFHNKLFLSLSTAGAGGGNADGYMEIFAGLGYKQQLEKLPIYTYIQGELGMGGGGKIDSGGGTMWRVRSGVEAHILKHFIIGIDGGYIQSFQGSFKAKSIGVFAGIKKTIGGSGVDFKPTLFSVREIAKTHFSGKGDFKDSNKSKRIDMLGIAFDHYFNNNFYITGQALWAYKGNAGGYAEGLLGLGWQSNQWHKMRIWGEALVGAGGGGGVKTNGGILGSISIGTSYALNKSLDIIIGAGYTKSTNKGLSSADATLGLRYRFALPQK